MSFHSFLVSVFFQAHLYLHLIFTQKFLSLVTLIFGLRFLLATETEVLVISGVPQMTAELVQQAFGVLFKGSPYKLEINRFAFEDSSVYISFTDPTGRSYMWISTNR